MKRILGIFFLSLLFLIGVSTASIAGDLELGLNYQQLNSDLTLGIDGLGEISTGDSGSAASVFAKYWFTPRWWIGADYTWGDFSNSLLLDGEFDIFNIEVGYLHPFTDKFSLGGVIGYTKFSEDGAVIHHNLFNYDAEIDGLTLGIKSVYKPTEKFSLSLGYNVMISADGSFDATFLEGWMDWKPVVDASDAYYRQLVLEGRYQFTKNWAANAGYRRIWAGYEVNYTGWLLPNFDLDVDHVFDGLYLGVIYTF